MIVGLLFDITTISSLDRNLLRALKPTGQGNLHFNDGEHGLPAWGRSLTKWAPGSTLSSPPWAGAPLPPRTVWSPRLPDSPSAASCSAGGGGHPEVVPGAGPSIRDRHTQLRQQCGRVAGAVLRGVGDRGLGVAAF